MLVAILALTGCGGSSAPKHHVHLTASERRGKTLFIRTCGGCHQLADAGTAGSAGPALDTPWLASRVRETIADGRPSVMRAGLVTGKAAAEVAAYVAAATAQP